MIANCDRSTHADGETGLIYARERDTRNAWTEVLEARFPRRLDRRRCVPKRAALDAGATGLQAAREVG